MTEVPRGKRRRASAGKDDVLRTAAAVIARRGMERARFSDIAAETGLAVSTLQYLFGSREDLLIAAFELSSHDELARIDASLAGASDPLERLNVLVDAAVGGPEDRDAWLLWFEFWRAAWRDAELNQRWQVAQDHWREAATRILQDGVQSGAFRADLDPDDTSILLLAITDGVALATILLQDPTVAPEEPKRLARQGVHRLVLATN
jgi:AcrR family transcriptional regulator